MPPRKGLIAAVAKYDEKGATERHAQGEQMLVDRELGMRTTELCAKYNVSAATLYRRLDDALAARIVPTVDAYRERMNAALDEMMGRWEAQVSTAESVIMQAATKESIDLVIKGTEMRDKALSGMLRVLERRAKLNGLDAPVKVEHTVTVGEGVDARVEALMKEVSA